MSISFHVLSAHIHVSILPVSLTSIYPIPCARRLSRLVLLLFNHPPWHWAWLQSLARCGGGNLPRLESIRRASAAAFVSVAIGEQAAHDRKAVGQPGQRQDHEIEEVRGGRWEDRAAQVRTVHHSTLKNTLLLIVPPKVRTDMEPMKSSRRPPVSHYLSSNASLRMPAADRMFCIESYKEELRIIKEVWIIDT